jgi:hypothetical protein
MLDAMSVLLFVLDEFGPFEVDSQRLEKFIVEGAEFQLYVSPVLDPNKDAVKIGVEKVEPGSVG